MSDKLHRAQPRRDDEGNDIDPIDQLPSRSFGGLTLEERVQQWVEADALDALQNHIRTHPHITCQLLLQRRLLEETSWKKLSAEYGIPVPTLSAFYQRHCAPELLEFGKRLQETGEADQYL